MSFADKTLECRDCGSEFTFTAGEQEFFSQKGFTNEPTRCPTCRQARKQNRNSGGGGSYDRGDSFGGGGGGGYGNRRSGGAAGGFSSDRGPREMHTTTCSSCGREAQVPFVPRGDKPVYCRDCFQSQRDSRGGGSSSRW